MLMYMTTKTTKEAMFPHTGSWTLNEFILAGGDATSDNLAPRFAQIQYSWRASNLGICAQIEQVLRQNARAAAAATHCVASLRWVTKTRVGPAERRADGGDLGEPAGGRCAPLFPGRRRLRAGDPAGARPRADGRPLRAAEHQAHPTG